MHTLLSKHTQALDNKDCFLLDLGCGTGNYTQHLAKNIGRVKGVDLSPEMVEIASSRHQGLSNATFEVGDMTQYNKEKDVDIITALFHVVCYQTQNAALTSFFENAAKMLKPGGLLAFDFWYGPAVLTDRPGSRTKTFDLENRCVTRTAEPTLYANENKVNVCYELLVEDKTSAERERIEENHQMRYLFYPEIELFAKHAGFEILESLEWMKLDLPLSFDSWNGIVILRKQ